MLELLVTAAAFLISGGLYSLFEWLRPRRAMDYRYLIRRDLAALVIVTGLSVVSEVITHPIRQAIEAITNVSLDQVVVDATLSFWIRLAAFYVVWDFTLYWFHRMMHLPYLWPTHRWHHAPTAVWWLSGIRASLVHSLLFQVAFLWFWLFQLPYWVYLVLLCEFVMRNGWMHLNVNLPGQKWIEFFVVTPRYHAIHHADRPEWYNQNLGSLMTIWDRLFGTYIDPDTIDGELHFGLKQTPSVWRMILGI